MSGSGGWSELFGGGRGRILLFCWLGWVFDFHDLILFSFTKRMVAADLGLGLEEVAWIEGLGLFGSALGGLLFGRLADRWGRRRAMTLSILVYSAGALLTGLAQDATTLVIARMLAGLGVGGEWGIGHAVVAEHWSGRQRDRVHGILQAGGPLAMALAAVSALLIAPEVGWRTVFLVSAVPALLVFFARWAMPGEDRPPVARGEQVYPALALLAPAWRRRTVVLFLILVLHMTGFWCVYAELPGAIRSRLDVAAIEVVGFVLAVNCVHVFADVLFGFLAARFGRRLVFAVFCGFFAAAQIVLALLLSQLLDNFLWFTVAAALMGLGAGTWSCFGALFGELYPAGLRATASSLLFGLSRGAQLFSKPGIVLLFSVFDSFAPALWVGAACAVGSALLLVLLPRPR
ncbi:MAG: MFS transporter [Planctomycetota bacterium]|nr:MFS transporter [Planctomycetota bacterium]